MLHPIPTALVGNAGDLKALEAFFDAVGTRSDTCFMVVTHRGPHHDLRLEQGQLKLEPSQEAKGQRATIDRFLESLAADQGQNAAAIVF